MIETTNLKLKKWQGTDLVSDVLNWYNSNLDSLDANISLRQLAVTNNSPLLPQIEALKGNYASYLMRIGVHSDLPTSYYTYGLVRIFVQSSEIFVDLIPYDSNNRSQRNFYSSGNWVGWSEY